MKGRDTYLFIDQPMHGRNVEVHLHNSDHEQIPYCCSRGVLASVGDFLQIIPLFPLCASGHVAVAFAGDGH